jgi:hypothetical protein
MKRILTLVALLAGTALVYGQGTIVFFNIGLASANYTNMTVCPFVGGIWVTGTNTVPLGLAAGLTSPSSVAPNAYFYTLLIAPTNGPTPARNPLDAAWSQAMLNSAPSQGIMGTNYITAGSMVGPNGNGATGIYNEAAGTTIYEMLVGWSSGLGRDWGTVKIELQDNFAGFNYGFFGLSPVGMITLGPPAGPGTSIYSGWGGGGVTPQLIPEPSALALAGLGGLAPLLFRRRR